MNTNVIFHVESYWTMFPVDNKMNLWDFISAMEISGMPFQALRFLPTAPSRHWRCSSSLSAQKFSTKNPVIVLAKKNPKWNFHVFFWSRPFRNFRLKLTLRRDRHNGAPKRHARLAGRIYLGAEWSPTITTATKRNQEPTRSVRWWSAVFPLLPKVLSSRQWEFKGLWSQLNSDVSRDMSQPSKVSKAECITGIVGLP